MNSTNRGNSAVKVNFQYEYEYYKVKETKRVLKKGGELISSFSITLDKLRIFNDSLTMAKHLSTSNKNSFTSLATASNAVARGLSVDSNVLAHVYRMQT
jgi:hypothetical protein